MYKPFSLALPGVLAVSLLCCGSAVRAQTPTHAYNLNGNYADSLGGVSLTGNGGTFNAGNTALVYGVDQGPTLTNGLNASTYSVEMYVKLDNVSGYRKLVDFKGLVSDNGLYDLDGSLTYYLGGAISGTSTSAFTTTAFSDVILTRDNTSSTVVGYVNGVQQFTFADTTSDATFSLANQVANFFQDDTHTGGGEATSGTADLIYTYGTALTQSQVTTRYNTLIGGAAAPEPASLVLLLPALPLLGAIVRRRRSRV